MRGCGPSARTVQGWIDAHVAALAGESTKATPLNLLLWRRHWKQGACARYSPRPDMASPLRRIDLGTTNSVVAVSDPGQAPGDTDPGRLPFHPIGGVLPEGRHRGRGVRAEGLRPGEHRVVGGKRACSGAPSRARRCRRARSRVSLRPEGEGADSAVLVQTRARAFSLPGVGDGAPGARVAESRSGSASTASGDGAGQSSQLQRSSTKIAGKIAELDVVRIPQRADGGGARVRLLAATRADLHLRLRRHQSST